MRWVIDKIAKSRQMAVIDTNRAATLYRNGFRLGRVSISAAPIIIFDEK